jgi:hypothetical protein
MQNAKDTFYITLRDRLAALNPARTVTLRAITRPGILVEDAEAPMAQPLLDVFTLRWTKLETDTQLPSVLVQMICEIHYATAGTQGNGGLDRGRTLEAMDNELIQLLCPSSTVKFNFTQTPVAQKNTMIFWSQAVFAAAAAVRERMERVATVNVFAFQEQGEQ